MSLIDWFAARRKDQFVGKVSQDTDEGDGLWVKCSECSQVAYSCLLYTSPRPRDYAASRMPSSA